MGVSPKWVKSKRRRKKERKRRERLNDSDNNGQAKHGARKQAWRTQARMAHASRLGQLLENTLFVFDNVWHFYDMFLLSITILT